MYNIGKNETKYTIWIHPRLSSIYVCVGVHTSMYVWMGVKINQI